MFDNYQYKKISHPQGTWRTYSSRGNRSSPSFSRLEKKKLQQVKILFYSRVRRWVNRLELYSLKRIVEKLTERWVVLVFFWHPVKMICKTIQFGLSCSESKGILLKYCLLKELTIKGEDMLSNASSILFAVWLVTPLLPAPRLTRKRQLTALRYRFNNILRLLN